MDLQPYRFGVGDRVTGPGILGEVVARPGPYSVTIKQDRGGALLTSTTTDLEEAV
jgi:hypothetical protein